MLFVTASSHLAHFNTPSSPVLLHCRQVVGLPVHGQPDPDLWGPEPLQTKQEEDLQRSHGGGLRLPGGLFTGHEVSFQQQPQTAQFNVRLVTFPLTIMKTIVFYCLVLFTLELLFFLLVFIFTP